MKGGESDEEDYQNSLAQAKHGEMRTDSTIAVPRGMFGRPAKAEGVLTPKKPLTKRR